MKKTRVILFILVLMNWAIPSLAWYHRTHAYAAKIAVEVLREMVDRHLYEEIFSPDFFVELGRGAWREDYDPPIAGNERAQRHYYDPDSTRNKKGVQYYSFYVAWRLLDAPVTPLAPGECFEGAMRWALDGENIPENPFNWKDTIIAYGGGTNESKGEAYYRLGHVLHLLMDVSDPDHARNDPHPGSGKYFPDTVEGIAKKPVLLADEWMKEQNLITRDLRERVIQVMELASYGIKSKLKAKYGPELERRYGRDIRLTGFEGILEDSIHPALVEEFFLGQEKRNIGNQFPTLRSPSIKGTEIVKFENFQAYFDELARFAKMKQDESGLGRFLGLLNLSDFLLDRASGEAKDIPWLSSSLQLMRLFQQPIYVIPAVNEYDQNETKPYYDLGSILLKKSTEFGAGLLKDFHDIVNEPPYVAAVRINQDISEDEKPEQIRTYIETKSKEKTGRTKEKFDDAEYFGFPTEYEVLERRELTGDAGFFESGKIAYISITFGPEVSEIKEKIDPSSVHVVIAGKEIQGQMTDDHKWGGRFIVPNPPGDSTEATYRIEISAKDLHDHYPRKHEGKSLPGKGYELDSDPTTPAHASPLSPYSWEGYSPGVDKNYQIHVKKAEEVVEEEEERAEVPEREEEKEEKPRPPYDPRLDTPYPQPLYVLHVSETSTTHGQVKNDFYLLFAELPNQDGVIARPDCYGTHYWSKAELFSGPHGTLREICAATKGIRAQGKGVFAPCNTIDCTGEAPLPLPEPETTARDKELKSRNKN